MIKKNGRHFCDENNENLHGEGPGISDTDR